MSDSRYNFYMEQLKNIAIRLEVAEDKLTDKEFAKQAKKLAKEARGIIVWYQNPAKVK